KEAEDEEENEKVDVQDAEPIRERDRDVPENFDEGAEGLEDKKVGQPEHADGAVLGVKDHVLVAPQALEQAAVPAGALASQDTKGRRELVAASGFAAA